MPTFNQLYKNALTIYTALAMLVACGHCFATTIVVAKASFKDVQKEVQIEKNAESITQTVVETLGSSAQLEVIEVPTTCTDKPCLESLAKENNAEQAIVVLAKNDYREFIYQIITLDAQYTQDGMVVFDQLLSEISKELETNVIPAKIESAPEGPIAGQPQVSNATPKIADKKQPPKPTPTPKNNKKPSIIGFAITGGLILTATTFELITLARQYKIEDGDTSMSYYDTTDNLQSFTRVLWGVTATSAVVTAIVYLIQRKNFKTKQHKNGSLTPTFGLGINGLILKGRF